MPAEGQGYGRDKVRFARAKFENRTSPFLRTGMIGRCHVPFYLMILKITLSKCNRLFRAGEGGIRVSKMAARKILFGYIN